MTDSSGAKGLYPKYAIVSATRAGAEALATQRGLGPLEWTWSADPDEDTPQIFEV